MQQTEILINYHSIACYWNFSGSNDNEKQFHFTKSKWTNFFQWAGSVHSHQSTDFSNTFLAYLPRHVKNNKYPFLNIVPSSYLDPDYDSSSSFDHRIPPSPTPPAEDRDHTSAWAEEEARDRQISFLRTKEAAASADRHDHRIARIRGEDHWNGAAEGHSSFPRAVLRWRDSGASCPASDLRLFWWDRIFPPWKRFDLSLRVCHIMCRGIV